MQYYIVDTTLGNKTPTYYSTLNELVKHLEGAVYRKYKQTRKSYMQNLVDLGHGYDDPDGKVFTESLSKQFDMGVVKQLRHVRCNVHEVSQYSKYRTEMGD
jgi:hypothetical protein